MILYLVRHGETAYNRDGLALGIADVPLTERGRAQAQQLASRFAAEPLDAIYTSPLTRAATVADGIAATKPLKAERTDALIELDVGQTEGLAFVVMRERFPDVLREWNGPGVMGAHMPGGESLGHVDARVGPFLDGLLNGNGNGSGDTLVVSHNFVIRLALCHLLGVEPARFRSFHVDLASVTALRIEQGSATAISVNDTCHLNGIEP